MSPDPQAAHAEAVNALTARLEAWGVDDAPARAAAYVADMVRAGWRPRAPRATPPRRPKGRPSAPPPEYRQARAALRTPDPDAPEEAS